MKATPQRRAALHELWMFLAVFAVDIAIIATLLWGVGREGYWIVFVSAMLMWPAVHIQSGRFVDAMRVWEEQE